MSRNRRSWLLVVLLCFSASCWGRSVWADGDGGDLPQPVDPGCGNDRLEEGEECDGANLGGYTCQILGYGNGALSCNPDCTFNVYTCGSSEDCGNSMIDPGESCDGVNLNGHDCWTLGYAGGTLGCTSFCEYDTSMCQTFEGCGNGWLEGLEQCDDGNTAPCDGCNAACRIEMCANGVIDCGEECDDGNTIDGDGCSSWCQLEWVCGNGVCEATAGENCGSCPEDCCLQCGNNLLEPSMGEECDGPDLGGHGCHEFCYSGGTLGCRSDCTFDFGGCWGGPVCGDGIPECEEQCDLFDLAGADCQSLGFTSGTLACSVNCTYDTSGCTGQLHYLYEDFESAATVANWTLTGDWEWGVPNGYAEEPPSAYDGTHCLGTRVGADYSNNRSYMGNMAISPVINLSAANNPILTFMGWVAAEQCCDGVNVWVKPTSQTYWTHVQNPSLPYLATINSYPAWTGTGFQQWMEVEVDLGPWAGQSIQIAFAMSTDGSVTFAGAYVDRVVVTEGGENAVVITTPDDLGGTMVGSPFTAQLAATGGTGAFQWSIQSGSNHGWLSIGSSSGLLSGTPAAGNIGPVDVLVRATSATNPSNFDERWFSLQVASAFWQDSFDGGAVGWTLSGDWEWGTPSNVGPPSCHSGECIGLRMASEYSDQQSWNLCTATSPPINLAGTVAPMLRFWSWVDTEGSVWDGGNLKVSTGSPQFMLVTGVSPAYNLNNVNGQQAWGGPNMTNGWELFEADLSAYAGQTIRLQFAFRSDGSVTADGWYVDELSIFDQ